MKYNALTKIVLNENNEKCVACAFYGTEKCQIHNCNNCADCSVFTAILNQLYTFEQAVMQSLQGE